MKRFRSLYQNRQDRRRALDEALDAVVVMQRIPFYVLLFLLLGLPLFINPHIFTDLPSLLWWMKAWSPVWVITIIGIYVACCGRQAPAQVISASVDAMEQAAPDAELVPVQERVETKTLPVLSLLPTLTREATVQARRAEQEYGRRKWRRRSRLRELDFPALLFLPLLSSSQDSSA